MEAIQRVAVVSGGSSGIGLALVELLHAEGWAVYTCGRDGTRLQDLPQRFPGVQALTCDVTERASVQAFADWVTKSAPRINLVVSNAGGLTEVDFTAANLAELDLVADLRRNTEGAIHWISAFLPVLRSSNPASILIVSSGYALAPATRAPIYSAAKAALHSLSKSLRRQLAPLGISVTELLPPLVDTPAVSHRKGVKLSANQVAAQALRGALSGADEVRPGAVRFLPFLMRIAPRAIERMVART
ncbi:MAG: SDR family NAD(P)-dependent oxidoreductase [Stagnimonas sp.]|nr:SDR family NAD(P)-dependent oxidoreductase [Stagnimonas sp.]